MADNAPAPELPPWPTLEAWLSESDEGRRLLAGWRMDPRTYAPVVAAWVQQHAATAPSAVATYVSGGQIEQLVNIATAGELKLSGPVTVNVYSSAPLRQLGTETAAILHATGPVSRASFEPETVYVPGGSFLMGSDGGEGVYEYEKPRYVLVLPAYRIARYAITNGQYLEFVRRTRAAVPGEMGWLLASVGQEPPPGKGEHPVVGVSWDEAVGYCRWLSEVTRRPYRLPSEPSGKQLPGVRMAVGIRGATLLTSRTAIPSRPALAQRRRSGRTHRRGTACTAVATWLATFGNGRARSGESTGGRRSSAHPIARTMNVTAWSRRFRIANYGFAVAARIETVASGSPALLATANQPTAATRAGVSAWPWRSEGHAAQTTGSAATGDRCAVGQ
jgi:hypothetical protein